jgi:hypothetical protein
MEKRVRFERASTGGTLETATVMVKSLRLVGSIALATLLDGREVPAGGYENGKWLPSAEWRGDGKPYSRMVMEWF